MATERTYQLVCKGEDDYPTYVRIKQDKKEFAYQIFRVISEEGFVGALKVVRNRMTWVDKQGFTHDDREKKVYTVKVHKNKDQTTCECDGFKYHRHCKHSSLCHLLWYKGTFAEQTEE